MIFETLRMQQIDLTKPPQDNQIVGVVCVLQDFQTGEIFMARELMDKPQFDKRRYDYSPVAGGRESNGDILEDLFKETLPREMREETGLEPFEYVTDPNPIGWFQFAENPNKPWIVAYRAFINHKVRLERFPMPSDHETAFPIWVDPRNLDLNAIPLRGGVREILNAHLKRERSVCRQISSANHIGEEGIFDPFPPAIIVDNKGTIRELSWDRGRVVDFLNRGDK